MLIDCDFEPTVVEIGEAVDEFIDVHPGRHVRRVKTIIAGGNAEEKDFLSGDANQLAQQLGKKFWQPWTAGEDKFGGDDFMTAKLW